MAEIKCPTDLENLILDYREFINGNENSDVTLSDSYVMPSYQKFALEELLRSGSAWSDTKTYLEDDIISHSGHVYIAIIDNLDKQPGEPEADGVWQLVEKVGVTEGVGFSGYVSFLVQSVSDQVVLSAKNINSVVMIGSNEIEIVVNAGIAQGLGNRLKYAMSYTSESINQNKIKGYVYQEDEAYFVSGVTNHNEDNKINLTLNIDKLVSNNRIDLIFLEV